MIQNTTLTTTVANIYVSSGNSVLSTIHFCNYSGSPVNIHVYAVPSGNVAGNGNMIYSNVNIQGGDTYIVYQEKFILGNGQMIQANASANSAITTTVSYTGV